MIDFGNFYSLIAKNHLSHWLETMIARLEKAFQELNAIDVL